MKSLYYYTTIIVISGLCAWGCSKSSVDDRALLKYIDDEGNGLTKKDGEDVVVVYRPRDLIIEQEIAGKNFSANQVDSIINKLKEYDYFNLRISSDKKDILNTYAGDPDAYGEALDYLSFGIGKDIKLITLNDTLTVYDLAYFRGYGVNNASEVLIVFKSGLQTKDSNFKFLFDDTSFNTGLHEFEFESGDLKSIPPLTLIQ